MYNLQVRPLEIEDYARKALLRFAMRSISRAKRSSEIVHTHTAYVQSSSTYFGNRGLSATKWSRGGLSVRVATRGVTVLCVLRNT